MSENRAVEYRAWGLDDVAYGPVELPVLVDWIRDGRLFRESWIYREDKKEWARAGEMTELKALFESRIQPSGTDTASSMNPGVLRRMRLFAEMDERLLASFLRYMRVVDCPQHATLFRAGDKADSMFLVLEGEVRVRILAGGRESILATLGVGECFGELAVIDQGPRSADVVANQQTRLLSLSSAGLKQLFKEAPALAAPFLLALNRIVVGRIRRVTRDYQISIQFTRTAGQAAFSGR
jgi:hypothetical protein